MHLRRTSDAQRRLQRLADEGQHIRAAIDETLIVDQPGGPHAAVTEHNRARHERHRLGGVGHIFGVLALPGFRRIERHRAASFQVQRLALRRAALRTTQGPVLQAIPVVGAGVVDQHRRRVGLGRAVHQVLVEERLQHVAAELQRGIAVELQRTQRGAAAIDLTMPPRPHHQIVAVVVGVARLHRRVAVDRTPHVFLIPQALQPHRRHFQRGARHDLVQRLELPERIVSRVLGELVPPRQLLQASGLGIGTDRTGAQELAVANPGNET